MESPSWATYPASPLNLACTVFIGADHGGYGVGQIDLPEGPRVQAVLSGGPDDFRIGMEMQIELETLRENREGQEVVIYRFRPAEAAAGDEGSRQ